MEKAILTWDDIEEFSDSVALSICKEIHDNSFVNIYGVPRGGVYAALAVKSSIEGKHNKKCYITNTPQEADFIIDDIVDSGKTKQNHLDLYDLPFYALIDKKNSVLENKWVVFPWEQTNQENGPEENVRRIIEYIGEDPNREGLIETPKRVVRSFEKLYGGYAQNPQDILKTFTEGACDEIVLLKGVELYSTCEHHMLPFYGKAHIAYLPDGKVVGVSKLARLLEIYARRLQIQERLGQQVTEALDTYLKPKGSACIIEAQHFCMTSRGVEKQNSIMITSSLTGAFRDNVNTRNELMSLIR